MYSSEIPWAKPHPLAFRAALDAVGVADPARAVFVGDRLFEDVFGAHRAGLHAVLVPHSDIPPAQIADVQATPDAVVRELVELVGLIDGWQAGGVPPRGRLSQAAGPGRAPSRPSG